MRNFTRSVILAAALLTPATFATAEDGWGLNLGFSFDRNTTTDTDVNELFAQGSYNFSRFGLQLDLSSSEYDFDSSRRFNAGLHAYYGLSDQFKIGAYAGRQDWFGSDYDYYGLELAYQNDRLKTDGHVGKFETSGAEYTMFGADFRYLLFDGGFGSPSSGPFSGPASSSFGGNYYLIGGWHGVRDLSDENLFYIGASAEFQQGLFLDLTAARVADNDQIGFMIRKEFGNGVPFHRRGWTPAFKAW